MSHAGRSRRPRASLRLSLRLGAAAVADAELATCSLRARQSHDPAVPHWSDFLSGRTSRAASKPQGPRTDRILSSNARPSNYGSIRSRMLNCILIWLLDYFRSHAGDASPELKLVQADVVHRQHTAGRARQVDAAGCRCHRQISSKRPAAAWQAYRAPTPEACFDLLGKDLSALAAASADRAGSARRAAQARDRAWRHGNADAGADIGWRDASATTLFPGYRQRNKRACSATGKSATLLDGLAHGPAPAVAGLDEGPFTLETHNDLRDRHARYKRQPAVAHCTRQGNSRAGKEDFSRHNPIDRWWGGTRTDQRSAVALGSRSQLDALIAAW